MTVTNDLRGNLRIGKGFVDAVAGEVVSRGTAEIGGNLYNWSTTQAPEAALATLKEIARVEGKKLEKFTIEKGG